MTNGLLLAELRRGDVSSGAGSWLVYLPTAMLASSSASPELRQPLTDNEAMHTRMDGPGFRRHAAVPASVQMRCAEIGRAVGHLLC